MNTEYTTSLMPAEDVTLYALWAQNSYIVAFDSNGGESLTRASMEVTFDCAYGELQNASKVGHTFIGWFTELDGGDEIYSNTTVETPNNHTLYAHWTINSYTITFDLGNGTVIRDALPYNTTVEYPVGLTREGYTFDGWNTTASSTATPLSGEISHMPAHDVTAMALWTKASEYVQITIGKKDLSEEEVRAIVEEYAGSGDFTIERFDAGGEETMVIIKFNDPSSAAEFVRRVNGHIGSHSSGKLIRRVGYFDGDPLSLGVRCLWSVFSVLLF